MKTKKKIFTRYSWKNALIRNTIVEACLEEYPICTTGIYKCLTHHLQKYKILNYIKINIVDLVYFTYELAYSKFSKMYQYYWHSTSRYSSYGPQNVIFLQWHSKTSGKPNRKSTAKLNDLATVKDNLEL